VNPSHPLIVTLAERQAKGEDVSDAAQLLLDQAVILEGETPDDVAGFAERLSALMAKVYG
jgi:molecular chaperone HtpG